MKLRLCALLLAGVLFAVPTFGLEVEPLTTRNLAPQAIGFGLPTLGPARVLAAKRLRLQGTLDLVSNFADQLNANESLLLDGETTRVALSVDYGIGNGLEVGLELPLVSHRPGFLDGFIEGWHDLFGLPQAGRDLAPRDRLDYSYQRSDGGGFDLDQSRTALGALALRAGWQCWQDEASGRALALRANLKLPTGRSDRLTDSESVDLALWLSGAQRSLRGAGPWTLYGGGGVLYTTDGDLLPAQRRNLVGLINLGIAWQPRPRLAFQLQFDAHSAFFRDSAFEELDSVAGQLAIGGSLALGERTTLELAVLEGLIVENAPDVGFHLALRRSF